MKYLCVVTLGFQKLAEKSLCSFDRLSENRQLIDMEEAVKRTTATKTTTTAFLVEVIRLQQSTSTHLGAGEKDTLNINVL